MIKLENITKYYPMKGGGLHYVLKDLNLEIPPNRNIGIMGPNGSGKSTLLRLIGGAEAPNAGKIITNASVSWPLGLGAGFQGSLTGRQNVLFVCEINGLSKLETQLVVDSIIEFSELGEFLDMPVKSYSSGMRARLGFGLSVNFEFDYYLIDELTSVGDAVFRKKANEEFRKIKESASSLIYVTHNTEALKKTCESAILLNQANAEYFENIDEGIKVYRDYIRSKNGAAKKAGKKAAKRAGKKAGRNI